MYMGVLTFGLSSFSLSGILSGERAGALLDEDCGAQLAPGAATTPGAGDAARTLAASCAMGLME